MTKRARRRWALMPAALAALALLASGFANAVPAAADEGAPPTEQSVPAVQPPSAARAVATSAGTDVAIVPSYVDTVDPLLLAPDGYQVVACGPFALNSVQFTAALTDGCDGDVTRQVIELASGRVTTHVDCTATESAWCMVIVRARHGDLLSSPVYAGAGGAAPHAPKSVSIRRDADRVTVVWTPGAAAKQQDGLPDLGVGFELRRNGRLVADYIEGLTFTDTCSDQCAYSVRAVSAAGRSLPAFVVLPAGEMQASGGPVDPSTKLTGNAQVNGAWVTVSGSSTPTSQGASTTLRGSWNGAIPVVVPVNRSGGWSYSFRDSMRGAQKVSVRQTDLAGRSTSITVDYRVLSLRAQAPAVKVPGAPTKVTAVAVANAVNVSWRAPASNGGASISRYVVTATPGGKLCTYNVPKAGAALNTCRVTGLAFGTTYTFAVKAYNSAGASAAAVSPSVTPKAAPAAPARPTVVGVAGGITVTWTAPASNGSPITSYKATATPGNASCTYVVPSRSPANSCTITGLTSGVSYTVKVVAKNAVDWSPASPASANVTVPSQPAAPTAVSAQSMDGAASVSWLPPASTGGAPITAYKVTMVADATKTCTYFVPATGTPANTCTVSGLTNGNSYQFAVVATNVAGDSAASSASSAMVAGAPGPVTDVTATAENGRATIAFANIVTIPSGMNFTNYTVTVDGHPEIFGCTAYRSFTSYYPVAIVAPTANCTISGLTNGVEYTFSVQANVIGPRWTPDQQASSPAARSNAVTPSAPPSPPRSVTVYSFSGGALLSWEAPADNGGSTITGYRVTATPADGDPLTYQYGASARRVGINGLENGVRYSVSVTAVTERGTGTAVASSAALFDARTSAPTNVTAVGGDSQATVTWDEPSSAPFPVLSYTVTATDYFSNARVELTANSSPATFTGLTNGHTYTFTVTANNDAGASPASAPSSNTLVATLPQQPLSASVESGNRYVTVTWAPVDFEYSGGSTVATYVITATPSTGPVITKVVVGQYTGDWTSLYTVVSASDGLVDGVDYTFTVAARNSVGDSRPTAAGSTRSIGAPSSVVVTSAVGGNGRATITWNAPTSAGGAAVTRYNVSSWGGSCAVFPVGDGPYTCTVTGLSNGSTYGFTVEAQNAAGSSYSNTAWVTPQTTAPLAPTNVSAAASAVNARAAVVTWTVPEDNGGSAITSFTATASPGGRSCSVYSASTTSCVVYGLTVGTSYTFTVTASSVLGTGAASVPSEAVMVSGLPGQPTAVVVRGGPTTATVSFDAPAANGSPVDNYEVTIVDYDAPNPPSVFGTGSPITVSGLVLGHTYRFYVTAHNSWGWGFGSEWTDFWVSANKPSAPTITSVIPGETSAFVEFTTPANGGAPITSYEVTAVDGTEDVADTIVTVTSSPAEVSGLITGHSYRFTVRATNVAGDSPSSIVSSAVVPQAAPGAPSAVAAEPSDGGLVVSFAPPEDLGGSPVTGYRVWVHDTVTGVDSYTTGAQSPIAIGGLINAHAYTVSVQATKSAYIAGPYASSGSTAMPAGVPGAPINVVAANAQDRQSTVTFTAPSSNGAAITSYTVTAVDQAAPFATVTATGASSPIVLTGLVNRHEYRVSVMATNRMGTGSATSNVGYTRPTGPPAAPTITSVVVASATSAQVAFAAPLDNGGALIDSYSIVATDRDDPAGTRTLAVYASPATVTGLVSGDTYVFSVAAANVSGVGPSSDAVPVVPQAATAVEAVAGDGQAEVRWSIPETQFGEPATYTARTDSGRTCMSSGSNCVITGLTNYTTYSVTVTASNAGGSSAAAGPVSVTPVPTSAATEVPSAPRTVSASPRIDAFGDGAATVTWEPPSDSGGGAITGYVVTTSPSDVTCTTQYAHTCVLTGLDPYALYTVRVVATNSVGASVAGVSGEVSACGFDTRQTRCKWQLAGQQVRAEQVDGGVRVSWKYGTGHTAYAMPSGRTCTSVDFDPVTLTLAPVDLQQRHYCVISGSFDPAESFRVERSDFDSSSAVHATWVSASAPAYTRALSPRVTGTLTSGTAVSIVASPIACADPLDCTDSVTFDATVTGGVFDVPLSLIDEGTYSVYVANPALLHTLALTTPQVMVVDRSNPTPLTVPAGPSVVQVNGVDSEILGVDFERTATVFGLAECDAVNTFTLEWYAGSSASGTPLSTTSPTRTPLGAVCWYSSTLAGVPDGTYTAVLTLADPSGNVSTVSENVVVDSVAPNLAVTSPDVSETVPSGIVVVAGSATTATADDSTVAVSAVRGSDTIARTVSIAADGSWSTELPLDAGLWDLSVIRGDRAGNRTTVTRSVTVVDSATVVSVTQPIADTVVSASTAVIGWAIPGSRVTVTSGEVELDVTTAAADGSWSSRVTLDPAATSVSVSVGTASVDVPISVGIPAAGVSIANPGVGGRTNGRPLTGTGPAGQLVSITVDSASASALADADGQWVLPLNSYSAGVHAVTASAGGSSATLSIIIDRSVPSLGITSPVAGSTRSTSVAMSTPSTVADASTVQLSYFIGTDTSADPEYVADATVTGAIATSALPTALADGQWTLVATRADAAGNVARDEVTFTYDRRAPVLSSNLASSMPGPLSITGTSGTASGDQDLLVTVDGQDWTPPAGGAFTYTPAPAITSGVHTVVLRQVDDAGNETVRRVSVTVDSVAPDLTAGLDGTGADYDGLKVTGLAPGADGPVEVTATPCTVADAPCPVDAATQRGSAAPWNDGRYAIYLPLSDGYWYVTTSRVDAAGNSTKHSELVLVDVRPPALELLGPDFFVTTRTLHVWGTTEMKDWRVPSLRVTVTRVGAASAAFASDVAIVDGAFSIDTTDLADGVYDVVVNWADPVHPTSRTKRVTIDASGPALTFDAAPDHGVKTFCATAGNSPTDISSVNFRFDLVAVAYGYAERNSYVQSQNGAQRVCVAPPVDGDWRVSAWQSDNWGNMTEVPPVAVRFDRAAPRVSADVRSPGGTPRLWAGTVTGTAGTDTEDAARVHVVISRLECTVDCDREFDADVAADGTWSADLASLPQGAWRIASATQSDAAGNVGAFTPLVGDGRYAFAVDRTPPNAPTITEASAELIGQRRWAAGTLLLRACAGSAVVPYTITVNAFRNGSADVYRTVSFPSNDAQWCGNSGVIMQRNVLTGAEPLPNGNYSLVAEVRDPSGRVVRSSATTYVSNWVMPRVAITGIVAGDNPNAVTTAPFGAAMTVSGTATYNDFDPRTVSVTFDAISGDQSYRDSLSSSAFIASASISASGQWSTTVPANLPVGVYKVTATQGSGKATSYFAVTMTAPVVESAIVTGERAAGTDTPLSTQTIVVSGSAAMDTVTPSRITGLTVTMTRSPAGVGSSSPRTCAPTVTAGQWSCTLVGNYPNGVYEFTAASAVTVSYTQCTSISDAGACTTRPASATQRVPGSASFTLNGEVPYPTIYVNADPIGGWSTYGSTAVPLAGSATNRTGDVLDLTIRIYQRDSIANWPTIVETPYSTYTATAGGLPTRWNKEIYVPEGTWVAQVSQRGTAGMVGVSRPIEFTVDTSPPAIGITYPTPGQIVPSARVIGTLSGGYGSSRGSADTSNRAYAQDGSVTYYAGWGATSGASSAFEWVSTNQARTWADRSNNVFTSAKNLPAGKYTAVVEAYDENNRVSRSSVQFEVRPSLLPARPTITARLDGTTPITDVVSSDTGYHRITVRVDEKYGFGSSAAPSGWVTLKYRDSFTARAYLVNREATFLVPLVTGDGAVRVGFDGSADNSAVDVGFNWVGYLRVSSRPAQNLTTSISYPSGAGAPGTATVSATYAGTDSTGRSSTLPCVGGIATVTDSVGKVLGSGTLANGGRIALAPTAAGAQTLSVALAEGSDCGAASGTASVNLSETSTPIVTASVPSTPIPYVGGDAVINANVATSALTPLVVAVPVHIENAAGATVSAATVLTDTAGNARLHVTPDVAGNQILTVVAGGDRSGFQRTSVTITLPVEPAALTMTLSVDSAGTRAGEASTATLIVGASGSSGTVAMSTGQTPGADAETLTPSLVCATDCRATSRFPNDVLDSGTDGLLTATYTSSATGRVFTRTVSTGRVAWTPTLSTVQIGAGPPIGLTAVSGGSGRVNLAWVAPRAVGTSTITGYRVTASIGGLTVGQCTTSATTCSISGLANGTAVLFTAVTITSVGESGTVTTTAAAGSQVSATASPVAPTSILNDTVLRDHLVPASTKLLFPSAMADRLRTGTVTFHAVESVYCGTGRTICTPTRHDVTVDLATGETTDTLVINHVDRASIPARSLAAAGVTTDMLTPRSTVSVANEAGGVAVTVSTQVFVGAYAVAITADYAPARPTAVSSATTAHAASVTGAGAPVLLVDIASANISGGSYAPVNMADRAEGTEHVLSWSDWGVRDPRVGETAFVRASIDPIFGVDDDKYAPIALAISQPGVDALFASPDRFSPNDRLYAAEDMYGSERTTIAAASTPVRGQPAEWRRALAGTGLSCAGECMVWALRNLDSTDPIDAGGLNVGTHEIGVMSYASSGAGITSTTLNVQPWETTQMAQAALTTESAGQKIRILTAARWTGMAPEVQTSMANVTLSVQLTHAGTSRIIAICFYSSVCMNTDGNGTTFLPTDITAIGARMAMEIDPAALGYTLTSADSVVVTTSTPWGITAVSPSLALNAPVVAVATTGSASITTSGQWLGAVLQEPTVHSTWWWAANTALDWFRNAQHSLWMSIFRSEAVASFLMTVTSVALSLVPGYDILTALACSSWTCAAGALAATVAGPAFAGLKAGFGAFKSAVTKGLGLFSRGSAAAAAPGRLAKFFTAVKSQAASAKLAVATSTPVSLARAAASTIAFRASLIDSSWLMFGKFAASVAVAEIKQVAVPAATSFSTIRATYDAPPPAFGVRVPASDPAFRAIPDYTLLVGTAMESIDDTADGRRVAAWDAAVQEAYSSVAAANPPQPTDVGFGPGVAMQFAHQFASQVSIALPNLSDVDMNASKVQIYVMRNAYDASSDISGQATSPSYRALYGSSTFPEDVGLAALGTCSLAGACTTLEGLTATVFRGSLEISGVFPQSVSWIPRGAWIKYLVTVVSRTTGAVTKYRVASNIAFPGRAATNTEMGDDGAVTMAYVRPTGTDPVGPYTPWPTGSFDPTTQYSPDTAVLTGGL